MAELNNTSLIDDGNLLAYYRFNTGALTTDSSGNSRTLTNTNSVAETASGQFGYAADYGSGNSNKRFDRSEDIWNNGAFSISCWLKRDVAEATDGVFSFNDAGTDKQLGMQFFWDTSDLYLRGRIFRVGVGYDNIQAIIDQNLTTGWHHYALTLTTGAGGTLKTYMDGVEKGSGAVTNASGTVGQVDKYQLGFYDGQYFSGLMDDVAFFSDVLTPAEIKVLAQNTRPAVMNMI